MGNENVEIIWYGLCLIKAAIFLVAFLPVALLCKWLLRRIPWKSVNRHSITHMIAHSLDTPRPPRNFNASHPKAVYRSLSERKKRIG
jgi:hypothetical protein